MNFWDVLVLAAIIGAAAFAMSRRKQARRRGRSCCDGCAGCGAKDRACR
ncbi:MAG: FeoB-associated Cys-rich membrane protein [Clostridia bacterium]|nr:FeoB-associated Cys-rich membrane protein [Clostridia bacterium]